MDLRYDLLQQEAAFAAQLLQAGNTLLGRASDRERSLWFRAFVALGTGIDRLMRLVVALDRYLDAGGVPPSPRALARMGHDPEALYAEGERIARRRGWDMTPYALRYNVQSDALRILGRFMRELRADRPVWPAGRRRPDALAEWAEQVDGVLDRLRAARNRRRHGEPESVQRVLFGSGEEEARASFPQSEEREEAVVRYRQIAVAQIIRYGVVLLGALEEEARRADPAFPSLTAAFGIFMADDRYLATRRTYYDDPARQSV